MDKERLYLQMEAIQQFFTINGCIHNSSLDIFYVIMPQIHIPCLA